jgi:hypothetical protein
MSAYIKSTTGCQPPSAFRLLLLPDLPVSGYSIPMRFTEAVVTAVAACPSDAARRGLIGRFLLLLGHHSPPESLRVAWKDRPDTVVVCWRGTPAGDIYLVDGAVVGGSVKDGRLLPEEPPAQPGVSGNARRERKDLLILDRLWALPDFRKAMRPEIRKIREARQKLPAFRRGRPGS